MKNLTSLQILMLMSLAVGSSQLYSYESDEDISLSNQQQAIQAQLKADNDEQATAEVLTDLAKISPKTNIQIIKDEAKHHLNTTFNNIKSFVEQINKEVETLMHHEVVDKETIAKLAVEATDAQAELERSIAEQRATRKNKHHYEGIIKDMLMKAEQGLKLLNKKAMDSVQPALDSVQPAIKNVSKKTKQIANRAKQTKAAKNIAKTSEQVSSVIEDAGPVVLEASKAAVKRAREASQDLYKKAEQMVNTDNATQATQEVVVQARKKTTTQRK